MNKSPGLSGDLIKRKCIDYDVEEKDPSKKVIATFESVAECSKFLGLRNGYVCDVIKYKTKNKTNKLKKTICIR